ncbi:MAG: LapA family protein [Pseudomonadota bacterium]|jgi:uncharacterized integral membrane protein|nr:LapA family protein [Pseudomonadota bacterium]QKK04361.1 MAG: LapA family protein [Pseudomonadota bacterium]|tara:strand:- start:493 stop:840 length:348 start_codon:yes stop_codon:yes gene_type:complete
MMKYFSWFITIPLTVLSLMFLIGNTDNVSVYYWMDTPPYELPLYAVGLAMLAVGFLGGALFVSLNYYALRHEHWKVKRRLARIETELEESKKKPAKPAETENREMPQKLALLKPR